MPQRGCSGRLAPARDGPPERAWKQWELALPAPLPALPARVPLQALRHSLGAQQGSPEAEEHSGRCAEGQARPRLQALKLWVPARWAHPMLGE